MTYSFTCTGSCLLQDADVIEGSTLPGNTTAFRDAVVYELQSSIPARSVTWIPASGVRTWPTRSQLPATGAGAEEFVDCPAGTRRWATTTFCNWEICWARMC